jgi:hypothetical protein
LFSIPKFLMGKSPSWEGHSKNPKKTKDNGTKLAIYAISPVFS